MHQPPQFRTPSPVWNCRKQIRERVAPPTRFPPLPRFQDPSNRFFSLSALSVLATVTSRISSCVRCFSTAHIAETFCFARPPYSPACSADHSFYRRTHRDRCEAQRWAPAIADVRSHARTEPASRCVKCRSIPHVVGRKAAQSRGCGYPLRIAMQVPVLSILAGTRERSSRNPQQRVRPWIVSVLL